MYNVTKLDIQLSFILESICNKLQITKTQHSSAEEKYEAVGKWLAESESPLHMYKPTIYPQGSFKIGTTVKPLLKDEYDIDLVCELEDDVTITEPMSLLEKIYQRIRSNETYKSICQKKNRCVCINYAGNFHLDILPARSDPSSGGNCILVPDRKTKDWKPSNPIGYAEWFEEVATVTITLLEKARIEPLPRHETLSDKLPLQQTVQLLKRWRDISFKDYEDYAPPSIVLTTLAGNHYNKELLITESLTKVISGILENINNSDGPIQVYNPKNSKECLSEKWIEDEKKYYMFVKQLVEFKSKWDNLFQLKGTELYAQLEKLFGEDLVNTAVKEYAQSISVLREQKRLGIDKTTGVLTGLGSGVKPVLKNTFYGSSK